MSDGAAASMLMDVSVISTISIDSDMIREMF
jgi:hypothetical protein